MPLETILAEVVAHFGIPLLTPLLWSIPMAMMVSELVSAILDPGD
jgi:hypothetical protein